MDLTEREKQALKIISSQHEGQIFLKALMRECHYQKPTITLTQMRDLSLGLTAYYEALRSVWLDLRVNIEIDNLSIIELDEVRKEVPTEAIKDVDHERSNESNTDPTDDTDSKSVGGTVRKRRDKFERDAKEFAKQYISGIYPEPEPDEPEHRKPIEDWRGDDESTDSGGA
jgi:hypothetical protein